MIFNKSCHHYNNGALVIKTKQHFCLLTAVLLSSAVMVGCSQKTNQHGAQSLIVQNNNNAPNRYQVRAGDTVSKIASRYGLNWRTVSALNNLDANHTIYVGQWLTLWQDTAPKRSSSHLTASTNPIKSQNKTQTQPDTPKTTTALVGSSALMRFGYPVGRNNAVVRQFGTPTNYGLTEGMFFAGQAGDVILASLGGQVVRVDSRAARPVIVIEHADGYATSYFDINNVRVRQGQTVFKGEQLGQMTAQTSSGMALFEFRLAKDGRFIDPVSVMH